MIVYFDSSAIVKLLVAEEGSDLAALLWDRCDAAVMSRLGYAEVCAALAAAFRGHRLDERGHGVATALWSSYAASMQWIDLTRQVSDAAGSLVDHHPLKGADAVHLASALAIGVEHAIFATWDTRLRESAMRERLTVSPT